MGVKKKAPKSASKASTTSSKIVNEALTFDDKLTRRLPTQDLVLKIKRETGGEVLLGIQLGNHPLGTIIRRVEPGGCAEQHGLKRGDVIATIDNIKLVGCKQAADVIRGTVIDEIEISYYFAKDAEGLLLKKRKAAKLVILDMSNQAWGTGVRLEEHPLGILVADMLPQLAAASGIKVGDVFTTIGGRCVLDVEAAYEILKNSTGVDDPTPICGTVFTAKAAALELVILNSSFVAVNDVGVGLTTRFQGIDEQLDVTTKDMDKKSEQSSVLFSSKPVALGGVESQPLQASKAPSPAMDPVSSTPEAMAEAAEALAEAAAKEAEEAALAAEAEAKTAADAVESATEALATADISDLSDATDATQPVQQASSASVEYGEPAKDFEVHAKEDP